MMKIKSFVSILLSIVLIFANINLVCAEENNIKETVDPVDVVGSVQSAEEAADIQQTSDVPEQIISADQNSKDYDDSDVFVEEYDQNKLLYADAAVVIDNVEYGINESSDYAYVKGYTGNPVDVTIESIIQYTDEDTQITSNYNVTSIYDSAFDNCTSLRTLTFPDSVEVINSYAFRNCTALSSVTLNEGLKIIGYGAFENCTSLQSIIIPSTVSEVHDSWHNDGAFQNCTSLTDVTINNTIIGEAMFRGCSNLRDILIPETVTQIGSNAFRDCAYLEKAVIKSSGEIQDDAFNGCPYLSYVDIENSTITGIGNSVFSECFITNITFPTTLQKIGSNAFYACPNLTSVTLNTGLQTIGYGAFENCTSLQSIDIPSTVSAVGDSWDNDGAFQNCTSLTKVTINNDIIGDSMFRGCTALSDITIPETVTCIGINAFSDCTSLKEATINSSILISDNAFKGCTQLTNIDISNSKITEIGTSAFYETPITSLKCPDTLSVINSNAFYNCANLSTLQLNDALLTIGYGAFEGCTSLKSVEIPATVLNIGDSWDSAGAFQGCSALETLNIKNTIIGDAMFRDCTSLKNIIIPDTVKQIGTNAFRGCASLKNAYFKGNAPTTFRDNVFTDCSPDFKINYLSDKLGWTTPEWNGYPCYPVDYIDEPSSEETSTELTTVTTTELSTTTTTELSTVTTTELSTVTTTELYSEATTVSYDTGSGSLYFDKSSGAIVGADKDLTAITIPYSIEDVEVTAIGNNAFSLCSNLIDITIPQNITSISQSAFEGCPAFTVHCYKGSYADNKSLYPGGVVITYITEPLKTGDLDGNGIVDSIDSLKLLKHTAGFEVSMNLDAADINGDGIIDTMDSLRLLRFVAGLIDSL